MIEPLENQLYTNFPSLFEYRNKKAEENSLAAWGLECGKGWFFIINAVCFQIDQYEKNIQYRIQNNLNYEYNFVKFTQIKEKFGGLRLYYNGGDDYVSGLVAMAETMSYKICEFCGDRGYPNNKGWIRTLCDKCRSESST